MGCWLQWARCNNTDSPDFFWPTGNSSMSGKVTSGTFKEVTAQRPTLNYILFVSLTNPPPPRPLHTKRIGWQLWNCFGIFLSFNTLNNHSIGQKCPSIQVEWQPEWSTHFIFLNVSISHLHGRINFWAWSLRLWKETLYILADLRVQVYILRPSNFRWRSNWFTTGIQGGGRRNWKSCSKWNGICCKLNTLNVSDELDFPFNFLLLIFPKVFRCLIWTLLLISFKNVWSCEIARCPPHQLNHDPKSETWWCKCYPEDPAGGIIWQEYHSSSIRAPQWISTWNTHKEKP